MRLRPPIRRALAALAALAGALVLGAATPAPRNLERALAAQRQLAAERPADGAVFNDLGNLLALSGDTRAAEEAYRKAIALAERDPGPHFNYGLLLVEAGERFAAWRQFRATVHLEPRHAWAWYEIGSLYEGWGLERRARRAYARAFALDPRLADARYNPSVLDNTQTTPAMLSAWRTGASATAAAPRGYAESGRIAGLLIDVPKAKAKEAAEPEAEAASGGGEAGGIIRSSGPPDTGDAKAQRDGGDEGGDAGDDALLVEGDDAAAAAEEGKAGAPRVITGADLRAPRPFNQVSPGAGATPGQPRGRGGMTPRGRPYIPGRNSTGRLEPVLRPATGAADPIAG